MTSSFSHDQEGRGLAGSVPALSIAVKVHVLEADRPEFTAGSYYYLVTLNEFLNVSKPQFPLCRSDDDNSL